MTWNDFPANIKITWAAADTETRLYIDGCPISTAQLEKMATPETPLKWWREHVTVSCYAWLISDGRYTACFDTFDTFNAFCVEHNIFSVWWYNAKFDFAQMDYAMLSTGWAVTREKLTSPRTFQSLHGRQGQRYSLSLANERNDAQKGRTTLHITRHFDFCNIIGGGLAKCLESFDVRDFDGKPVRKLEMDYQAETGAAERAYMENDVLGLYHLIRTANDFITTTFGYKIAGRRPDIMTAGALAKKVMLRFYGGADDRENLRIFQQMHPILPRHDEYYRANGLYRGGITFINPRYRDKPLRGPVYKYDVNSMYPANMARMPDILGVPWAISYDEYQQQRGRPDRVFILDFERVRGAVRKGMLPFWYDLNTSDYTPYIDVNGNLLMFDFEFAEMQKWYDIDFAVRRVLVFNAMHGGQYAAFVDYAYNMKRTAKKSKNKVQEQFAKLLLNSAYGKLAENPKRAQSHRILNEETGAVTLVDDDVEIDAATMLNVVQGACVTALSRCMLLQYIRETCPVPARDFVYCDTDSIHAFTQYPRPDAYELGALKDETEIDGRPCPYKFAIYLAPKTYLLYRCVNGQRQSELHTKGVPQSAVLYDPAAGRRARALIRPTDGPAALQRKFAVGVKFRTLAAMNVRGGKALIPYYKYLCRPDNATSVNGDTLFIDV